MTVTSSVRIGAVKSGEEFVLNGKTFRRIGPYIFGLDSSIQGLPYPIRILPNAEDGKPLEGHQNCVLVQEKETGAFFFAECWDWCEVTE